MKTLVAGGTGLIGSHIASLLAERGHAVTIGARTAPQAHSLVAQYDVLLGDYSEGGFGEAELANFDAVVFSAGHDVRHVAGGNDHASYWSRVQSDGVPAFMARAKRAGVRRAVQVGSYYHVVLPELIESSPYVRARMLADTRSRALADADFNVSTVNPPSIVGFTPGALTRRFAKLVAWGLGQLPDIPDFAPAGGTNYMSVRSLAEAVAGALDKAEPGTAYLVGDVNLLYRDYFQTIFELSGGSRVLGVRNEEHPYLRDKNMVAGRGHVVSYEPDPASVSLLGYSRNDVRPMLAEMVRAVIEQGGRSD